MMMTQTRSTFRSRKHFDEARSAAVGKQLTLKRNRNPVREARRQANIQRMLRATPLRSSVPSYVDGRDFSIYKGHVTMPLGSHKIRVEVTQVAQS